MHIGEASVLVKPGYDIIYNVKSGYDIMYDVKPGYDIMYDVKPGSLISCMLQSLSMKS